MSDWRTRPIELPVTFEDWLDVIADPGMELLPEDVQRHAWHIDEVIDVWEAGCRWCNSVEPDRSDDPNGGVISTPALDTKEGDR